MTEPAKDIPTLPSQIEDDAKRFEAVKKLLAAQANMVEVRGYELARLNPRGEWEQEERYQPTERGLNQAAANARWLNERHPGTLYQARVLVSAQIPDRPKEANGNKMADSAELLRGTHEGAGKHHGPANQILGPEVRSESPDVAAITEGQE